MLFLACAQGGLELSYGLCWYHNCNAFQSNHLHTAGVTLRQAHRRCVDCKAMDSMYEQGLLRVATVAPSITDRLKHAKYNEMNTTMSLHDSWQDGKWRMLSLANG